MKKIWLTSPFILSMLSFALFAEEAPISNAIEKSEVAGLFARKQKSSQDKACKTCCTPPMNYRLPAEFNGFNTFAEALVWQVQEQASFFAATPNAHSTLPPNANNSQLHGDIQSASFNWNGGIRAGLGYTFVQDAWQVLGQYTWYSTSGENSFSAPDSTTEFLMSTFPIIGTGPLQASSSAHFTYQMADLLLARRFLVKDRIQLNFSLGATGGYIKEDFHILYQNTTLNNYVTNNWAFGGGGLRTGIDANWHIIQGFGFFGKLSFAAVLGQYGNHSRSTADAPGFIFSSLLPLAAPHYSNIEYTGIYLLPATQIIFGFDWSRSFINCWISGVRVAVAGEFNHLSNLQQVFKNPGIVTNPRYPSKAAYRDISSVYMYGANVRLGADF